MYEYVLYPSSQKIIELAKIDQRLDDLKKADNYYMSPGFMLDSDLIEYIQELQIIGYFPKHNHEIQEFRHQMNSLFKDRTQIRYKVNGEPTDELNNRNIALLVGVHASQVLQPEEFANFSSYGASSFSEFIGTVGAYLESQGRDRDKELSFLTKKDGKQFTNIITGCTHGDLRIFQKDVTPYHTLDPVGKEVFYRPMSSKEEGSIIGYHSTESRLLGSILRHVYHNNISTPLFDNNLKELISYATSLPRIFGNTAEGLSSSGIETRSIFYSFHYPLRVVDENNTFDPRLIVDSIGVESSTASSYLIATNKEKDFMIGRAIENIFHPYVIYSAEDIDVFTKGLLQQASQGRGRTSIHELVNILMYRVSEEFKGLDRHEDIRRLVEQGQKEKKT